MEFSVALLQVPSKFPLEWLLLRLLLGRTGLEHPEQQLQLSQQSILERIFVYRL